MSESKVADQYLKHPVSAGMGTGSHPRRRLTHWLVGQFGRPTGFWGHVAGWIMANRPSNIQRNLWTVELLDIQPTDQVLEVGFGPGISIGAITEKLTSGAMVGVDHSPVMARQAARRNAAALADGRLTLVEGSLEDISATLGPFNKVLAVNVAMFWSDPVETLRQLRFYLAPDAVVALTIQPRSAKATDADALRAGELICGQLRGAGFRNVRLEIKPMAPVAAVCALGEL